MFTVRKNTGNDVRIAGTTTLVCSQIQNDCFVFAEFVHHSFNSTRWICAALLPKKNITDVPIPDFSKTQIIFSRNLCEASKVLALNKRQIKLLGNSLRVEGKAGNICPGIMFTKQDRMTVIELFNQPG